MLETSLQVPASLDQTLPDTTDSMFQVAALARTIHNTLIAMNTEGFVISQAEAADFSTYGGNLKTFIDNMSAREDEILVDGFSSIVATLPDVLPIIEAILSGGTAAIPSILLNAVVSQLFRSRNSAITAREGEIVSDLDATAIADSIDAMAADLEVIKDDMAKLKRGLVIPANGVSEEYFVDLFKAFGLEDDLISKLEAFLDTININLFQEWGTQRLSWGPPPVGP